MMTSSSPNVGSSAASAGRSSPGMVRSASLLMAIRAPVLPALTAAPASPRFTASTARPMLVVRARRSALDGFSSPPTTSSQWRISDAPRIFGWVSSAASIRAWSPTSRNLKVSCSRRARAAPSTMTRTPSSPPIASTAIRGKVMAYSGQLRSETDGDDFAAVVESAMRAQIVRTLQFATVRAFVMCFDLERIVRTAIAAAVGRYFSFGDGHGGTCSSINSNG